MSLAPKITNIVERTLDDLMSQFQDSPVILAVCEAGAIELQRYEDVMTDMQVKTKVDVAEGVVLDAIGRGQRVQRLGRTDDDFRRIVKVAVAANDSDAGAEQIIWIASELVGVPVQYINHGNAFFELYYESDAPLSDDLRDEAIELIDRAVPPGVSWRLLASLSDLTGRYDSDTYGEARYGLLVGGSV